MVNLLPRRPPASPPANPLSAGTEALLAQRLEQVRGWWTCRPARLPVAARLRTAELEPDLEEEPSLPALEEALQTLAERRRRLLVSTPPAAVAPDSSGRLLVCEFNMSIADGRSEALSEGFFDLDDRPPWDSWLVCFGRTRRSQPDAPVECLIGWVPEDFVPLASAGIAANASGSIYWVGARADGLPPRLAGVVRG